jgi:hypothetical protein
MTQAFAMNARLRIEFTSFWLSGTGTARGRHLDDVTHRDRDKYPAMPMTQVKGQLRETAERLACANYAGWNEDRLVQLFGTRTRPGDASAADTGQGVLAFRGEARLSEALRAALDAKGHDAGRKRLFCRIAATRIGRLGAAEDKTLRAVEAVVPVVLDGRVEWIDQAPPGFDWVELLDSACAATLAFGKLKADGYGRAIATVEKLS